MQEILYCDGALSDGRYAVFLDCIVLADTVPMNTSAVSRHTVRQMYLDSISPVRFDQRARDSAVDGQNHPLDAIRSRRGVLHIEPILESSVCALARDGTQRIFTSTVTPVSGASSYQLVSML
jgi:hypothetical protein